MGEGGLVTGYSSPILRTWAVVGRFSRVEKIMPSQIFLPCKGLATVKAVVRTIRLDPHVQLDVPETKKDYKNIKRRKKFQGAATTLTGTAITRGRVAYILMPTNCLTVMLSLMAAGA